MVSTLIAFAIIVPIVALGITGMVLFWIYVPGPHND